MKRYAVIAAAVAVLSAPQALHAAQKSAKDQALYEKAMATCNGPGYPGGARPYINYSGGWFRCVTPGSSRR